MVRAVVVTHGDLAAEMIRTAATIFGAFDGVTSLSNSGRTPQALVEELGAAIDARDTGDQYVVFVDFFGGSCCHACLGVERERKDVRVVTGVNLPMLLAFLNKREDVSFEQLPGELARRGQGSIRVVDAESL